MYVALVSLLIREPAGPASRATVWGCTKPHVPYVEYIPSHIFSTLAPTNEAVPTSLERRSRKKQGEARRISGIKPTRVHVKSRRGRSIPIPFMVSLGGSIYERAQKSAPHESTRVAEVRLYARSTWYVTVTFGFNETLSRKNTSVEKRNGRKSLLKQIRAGNTALHHAYKKITW